MFRFLVVCAVAAVGTSLALVVFLLVQAFDGTKHSPAPPDPPPLVAAAVPSMAAIKEARRQALMTARPTEYSKASRDELVRALGGDEVVAILREPDRVEAVLLKEPKAPKTTPAHEYVPSTDPIAVDADVATNVVEVLLDPQLHLIIPLGAAKGCYPVYGVRLSYWVGEDRVDLYLCFQCDSVAIHFRGKYVPYAQVQFAVEHLLNDVLQVFPDDPALKQLSGRGTAPAGRQDPYGPFPPTPSVTRP